jgi:hypothetical protein
LANVKETQGNIFVGKVERTLKLVADETKKQGGRSEDLT